MKLKYEFVMNEVADKTVAVAVGDALEAFNGFIKLNDVGAHIFGLLKEDTDVEKIVEEMKVSYADTPEDEIRETVEEFVGKLKDADLLV